MDTGVELDFLDGRYVVPDHLAALMSGMDTTRYRYADAVEAVNSGMLTQHLGKVQTDTIKRHFTQEKSDGSG